jgi:hypothetical protein
LDQEKGLTFKNKVYMGIFIGTFFAFICPYLIHDKFGIWAKSDTLSYYGTILGATATIIAVTLTIYATSKSAEQDRNNAINIAHRNNGLQICFDLLDALNFRHFAEIINKEAENKYQPEFISEKAKNLRDSITDAFFKFETFYSNIHKDDKSMMESFLKWYKDKIIVFENYPENRILVIDDIYMDGKTLASGYLDRFHIDVSDEHKDRFEPIEAIIKKTMLTYDFCNSMKN